MNGIKNSEFTINEPIRILLILMFFFIFFNIESNSQDTTTYFNSSPQINSINFNSNKLTNTYLLSGNALFDYKLLGGNLTIDHKYTGYTLNTFSVIKDSIHIDSLNKDTVIDRIAPDIISTDNEILQIKYSYPIIENMYFVFQNNWIYGSYNKVGRVNGATGIRFFKTQKDFLELNAGIEQNNQLGMNVLGPMFKAEGYMSDLSFEDYLIQTSLKGEYIGLTKKNKNVDIDINTSVDKIFSDFDKIHIDLNYYLMLRDYSLLNVKSTPSKPIETWFDSRINSNIRLDYSFTNFLIGLFDFSIRKVWKNRFYKDFIPDYKTTGVNRNRDILSMFFKTELKYLSSEFIQNVGMAFNTGIDENRVTNRNNIDENSLLLFQETERMNDYFDNSTRLYLNTEWKPTLKDAFRLNFSVSLYQYDSPSINENSDRDEFTSLFSGGFIHNFNNSLRLSFEATLYLYHQVYIKSQMSANNKWMRDISLNPKIIWSSRYFTVNPEFELFVKYTSFDFEDDSTLNLKGLSDRQIGYKDSITVNIGKLLTLQLNLNIRYFERGIFYWKSFSESPQNSRLENYIKPMLVTNFINNSVIIGCGVKYYGIVQKSLINTGMNELSPADYYFSIGPAVDIKFNFQSGSIINLSGCYEFQNFNNKIYKRVPIFYFNTKIAL